MFTTVILVLIAFLWWRAHKAYGVTGLWRYRRLKAAWSWAFVGAALGSFFGVAGFGGAITGAVPGALLGYLAASNLMKRDLSFDEDRPKEHPEHAARGVLVTEVESASSDQSPAKSLTTPPLSRSTKGKTSSAGTVALIVVAIVVGTCLVVISDTSLPNRVTPAPTPARPQPPPRAQSAQSAYDTELSRLETAFPRLNPDLPDYDPQLVEKVRVRMDEYLAQGLSEEVALRRAVAHFAPANVSSPATAASSSPPGVSGYEKSFDQQMRDRMVALKDTCLREQRHRDAAIRRKKYPADLERSELERSRAMHRACSR
jgi:hypothetical protein